MSAITPDQAVEKYPDDTLNEALLENINSLIKETMKNGIAAFCVDDVLPEFVLSEEINWEIVINHYRRVGWKARIFRQYDRAIENLIFSK